LTYSAAGTDRSEISGVIRRGPERPPSNSYPSRSSWSSRTSGRWRRRRSDPQNNALLGALDRERKPTDVPHRIELPFGILAPAEQSERQLVPWDDFQLLDVLQADVRVRRPVLNEETALILRADREPEDQREVTEHEPAAERVDVSAAVEEA